VLKAAPPDEILLAACAASGVDAAPAQLIRPGSNTIYRLPGGVIARVGRPGEAAAADKELRVGHWLAAAGVPAVRPMSAMDTAVRVADRPVTFWHELPPHRKATMGEIGTLLRQLHRLPRPEFELPTLAPLNGELDELAEADHFAESERAWLRDWISQLRERYAALPAGLPRCVVHGDSWVGNFVTTDTGPVMLDLERFAYGPPEWDLASVGLPSITLGTYPTDDWLDFCARYGHDVEHWAGFSVVRDICEIRKALFPLPPEKISSPLATQARHRLACLRGERGPRPWRWWPSP
jgi:Ser/Thr protein kinase RdoA (MazF antagonist)